MIVGDSTTERFWTERGLKQGCPLSPLLFIVFIADIEEYLKKRQNGGVTVGRKRIFTLTYADDLAVMAEIDKEMVRMLKSLERYFEEKRLTLNAQKSKVMVFCKKERERQERKWE